MKPAPFEPHGENRKHHMTLTEQLNALLPQTQCRECGFSGCLPYAQALAQHQAASNLCVIGKEEVAKDLAACLGQAPKLPEQTHQHQIAWIDEKACIGCTACIRACPVDAILGATKQMHTVISDECTGCNLCLAPCPVDCIHMQNVSDNYLPRARTLSGSHTNPRFAAAAHAKSRFERRQQRLTRLNQAKKTPLNTPTQTDQPHTSNTAPALNAAALIAQAMARASAQKNQRVVPSNRETFRQNQLKEAQQRSLYRRYQRDALYGNEQEKAAAIEWLRQYKAEQAKD